MTPHVIVADDHSMIRMGIKVLLMTKLDCKHVSECDSCNGIMNELKKQTCTHLVLDVVLSDGSSLEIVPSIRKLYPDVRILVFSMQPADVYAEAFRQYDVHYYLSKSLKEEEISKTLKRFLENENYPAEYKVATHKTPFSTLAPRELEILHYLLSGYKTQEIAETLNLGNSTISTFKKRIFEKTGTANLAQLYESAAMFDLGFHMNKINHPVHD